MKEREHREIRITFEPSGRRVFVLPGTLLLEAAAEAGIILQMPCGGRGTCGKCRLKVVSGTVNRKSDEGTALPAHAAEKGFVLACHTYVTSDAVIDVPAESMFETSQKILTNDTGASAGLAPAVTKTFFQLPLPSHNDTRSDLCRLRDVVAREIAIPPARIGALPGFLRKNNWRGTAVVLNNRIVSVEEGDTTSRLLGMAFDIGTTTVVGTLIDLVSGRELGVAARLNPQVSFGDDVISRIRRIREDSSALDLLQRSIIGSINEITGELVGQANATPSSVYDFSLAGNSTMQQILCGFDPSALGEVPFVQVFAASQTLAASSLGIIANRDASVYVFPQIESFVGGDTVAGMLATRLDKTDKPTVLVDIGTNGEIVLAKGSRMYATSTAAGPAFEGARITQGMRATSGAIEKIIIDGDVQYNVIGNARPAGICGTALIDSVAGLLRARIIDGTGRILEDGELDARVPKALRQRIITRDGDTAFVLAPASATASGEPICLWQRDVRELQLASAAIRSGITILLRKAGLEANDIGALLLAGAFGNFIRRGNARRIGLLPQIPCDRIRFIGNAASLGAKLALLSVGERRYAEELRLKTEHVDLSLDPGFQAEFTEGMMFPEGDIDHCDQLQ
ncbi:MAG: ASKHA domain-containing protein [bacterium]